MHNNYASKLLNQNNTIYIYKLIHDILYVHRKKWGWAHQPIISQYKSLMSNPQVINIPLVIKLIHDICTYALQFLCHQKQSQLKKKFVIKWTIILIKKQEEKTFKHLLSGPLYPFYWSPRCRETPVSQAAMRLINVVFVLLKIVRKFIENWHLSKGIYWRG